MTALTTKKEAMPLALGALTLSADCYRLRLSRPSEIRNLVDGDYVETVLAVRPCELEVEGRLLAEDADTAKALLRTAMYENTVLEFFFEGMQFAEMSLRDCVLEQDSTRQQLKLKLTLLGRLEGEAAL